MITRLDGTYCCPRCMEVPVKGHITSSCEFCGFLEQIMGEDGYWVNVYDPKFNNKKKL